MYGRQKYYGYLLSITACGLLFGSLLSARIIGKFDSKTAAWVGGSLVLVGGVSAALFPIFGIETVATIIAPMFLYALGNGVVMPAAVSLAISPFPEKAGAAAAFIGCAQSATGATCGYIVSLLYNQSAVPMTSMIGLMSILVFSSVLYVRISEKKQATQVTE